MLQFVRKSVVVLCLTGLIPPVLADEPAPPPSPDAPKKPAVSPDEVNALLRQLESGKYKERTAATKRLMEVGKAAIGPVAKAAHTDDLELGARCIDILKHYYDSTDTATKAEAEKALKELQQSKHPAVAKEAADVLRRRDPKNPFGNNPFGGNVGGGIRIQIGGIGGGGGIPGMAPPVLQREVNATENGKKIHIKETMGGAAKRQIEMTIIEKVNGKEKKTEYKVANILELRKKSREAYELYRKHIRGARLKIVGGNMIAGLPQPGGIVIGGGQFRMTTRTVNGVRTIDVEENGRKITIRDQNNQDIHITVTESVNGKEKTTEYKAKTFEELKKKHPDGAKIYQRFATGQRRAGAFGGIPGAPRAFARPVQPLPIPGGLIPVPNNGNDKKARDKAADAVTKANNRLQTALASLQKHIAAGNATVDELKKLNAEIEQAKAELERAVRNLRP